MQFCHSLAVDLVITRHYNATVWLSEIYFVAKISCLLYKIFVTRLAINNLPNKGIKKGDASLPLKRYSGILLIFFFTWINYELIKKIIIVTGWTHSFKYKHDKIFIFYPSMKNMSVMPVKECINMWLTEAYERDTEVTASFTLKGFRIIGVSLSFSSASQPF